MVDFKAANLHRKRVFEDTKWLIYVICGGRGIGSPKPLVISDVKELCIHSQAGTSDIEGPQGYCHTASTCVCFSSHFAFPPATGTYPCILCNVPFGTKRTEGTTFLEGAVYPSKDKFFDKWWLLYCFACGDAVHAPFKGAPLIGSQFKQFCCAGSTQLESPITEGVLCSTLGNFLCCFEECRMPPAPGGPKCACCTKKVNSDHKDASEEVPGEVKSTLAQ